MKIIQSNNHNKLTIHAVVSLLAMMICCLAFGQGQRQDVVYLENGSMVRGMLVEKITGSHVKLETADGSMWVFQMDEVKEITTMAAYRPPKRQLEIAEKGFYAITDFGMLTGRTSNRSVTSVSFQMVAGYQLNPKLSAGLGVGLESFDTPLAPLFAEGRYYLLKGKLSPFVTLQAGYAVPLSNYRDENDKWVNKGGLTANANIGLRNYLTSNLALVISAGFRHQQSTTTQYNWWFAEGDKVETHHYYNRIVLRLGVLFN